MYFISSFILQVDLIQLTLQAKIAWSSFDTKPNKRYNNCQNDTSNLHKLFVSFNLKTNCHEVFWAIKS